MNELHAAAVKLLDVGLSVIACDAKTKRPMLREWKTFQARLAKASELDAWFARNGTDAVAVVCGAVSGNVELLDFDFGAELYPVWDELVEAELPGLVTRLVHQKSQSGGHHVVYRCAVEVPGNMKLARRPGSDQKPVVLIETRGEGGYFLAAPTAGYQVLGGVDLTNPPVISSAEREVLIHCARSLDELIRCEDIVDQPPDRSTQGAKRPGDDYNVRGDIRAVLEHHGWKLVRTVGSHERWRRPGNTRGDSATLQRSAPYLFRCWSDTAPPFEREKSYSPFAVYALLEHGGDFSAAARTLAQQGYGERGERKNSGPADDGRGRIESILAAAGFDDLEDGDDLDGVLAALDRLRGELRGSDPGVWAIVREAAVRKLKDLGFRSPAKTVDDALGKGDDKRQDLAGEAVICAEVEPWPDAVHGGELLDEFVAFISRYVALPEFAPEFLALWLLHTHVIDAADVTPYAALTSPTKRCGKTTLLRVLAAAARRSLSTANISAAALFRSMEKWAPTLLVDEADTAFRPTAQGGSDDLRCVMNAGFERGGVVLRTVGDKHEPRGFHVFGPKVIALIGWLPATLSDRSVEIRMVRKTKDQSVRRVRRGVLKAEGGELARKAARWAPDNIEALKTAQPTLPDALDDRAIDMWEPLLAIAEVVAGAWIGRSQAAAVALSGARDDDEIGVLLLADLHEFFECRDRASTGVILEHLHDLEERRWGSWHRGGKALRPSGLADLLRPFGIRPRSTRMPDGSTPKGYRAEQFKDAWRRYLPTPTEEPPSPLEQGGDTGPGHEEII